MKLVCLFSEMSTQFDGVVDSFSLQIRFEKLSIITRAKEMQKKKKKLKSKYVFFFSVYFKHATAYSRDAAHAIGVKTVTVHKTVRALSR